ncbi:MAG: outer membrane protein assembly factor BamA [Moraxellaceae bacterium]|nr:outer membrane protein assembly factor BamA [Pseudobdellovibrionaceae bacterium]
MPANNKTKLNQKQKSIRNESGLIVRAISIEGLKKIEKDAVLAKLISRVEEPYLEENVEQDIQALFKMGYFVQIEVSKDRVAGGMKLNYKIIEKPTVAEITFEGNGEIKSEELQTQSGLKQYEVINYTKIQDAVVKLLKSYEDKGYYLVKIEPVVEDIKKDETVRIKFSITESDKVKVKKITFIGNKNLKDSYLKNDPRFFTKEAGYFSFISSSGSYKQEAFDNDIQVLRYLYWNLGYLQVKIDRPLVTVTPDKKSIYVTYYIDEGEQYSVGEVDFAGDLLFSKSELYESTKIKDNGIFSVEVMRRDITELQAKYGDLGYAFANVIPRYNFHEKEKKVDLVFEFDKGQKVYFGEIIVTGNSKTRDKVVRRELKIEEGELYNETRKRRSLENVQRLGFFEEVNFKTSTPPDAPTVLNIEIVVKERNTGQIQLTAAYGSTQGFSLGGSVIQNNFRGMGQALEARVNASKNQQDYKLSLTDPYFNDTLWSAGFDVFYLDSRERINYDLKKIGGNIRFGHPIFGDYTRAYVRYKLDKTDLYANQYTDPIIFPLETARGITSSATLTLEYDTRNDRMFPSKGIYTDVSYERAGLGGDLRYQEFSSRFRFFVNPFWDVVWRNNLSYSNIQPLDGDGTVPFSELYQMGGPYTLRGYGASTVGKRTYSQLRYDAIGNNNGNPFYNPTLAANPAERLKASNLIVGGTKQALFQTELQFPLIKEAGLSGVFFYDVGQAYDEISSSNLLSDVGMGFRWMSPLGLLRFEWGWPLQTDDYNSNGVNFEFSIGPPF